MAASGRRRHLVGEWSVEEALAQRLKGQFLDRRAKRSALVAVCGAMGGAQAQVGSAARLSLSARVDGMTDARLRDAVEKDRTLVKTWTVRGTLHLIPAQDLAMYVHGIGVERRAAALRWLGRSGLDEASIDALQDDILEALADGPRDRREIADRVGDAHGAKARKMLEHSWGGIFHSVTNRGLVCFGPSSAGRTTFVRVDRWLGAPLAARDPAECEAGIARRFVRAYGPATVADFAYWAGLYVPVARRMWERIADELRPVTVDGKPMFVHESVKASPERASGVLLLPNFDAYLLGHRKKDACVEPARAKRVFKSAGWIAPTVVIDGRVRGTWGLERGAKGLVVRVAAFRTLAPSERDGVAAEAARIAAFAGAPVKVRYGKSARPKAKVAWTGP